MSIKKQEGYYVVMASNNLVLFRSLTRRFCVEWLAMWECDAWEECDE